MNNIYEMEQRFRQVKSILRSKYKVNKIGYIGSYAIGDSREEGIDVLVDFFEPVEDAMDELKDYLEHVLGRSVKLVFESALDPQVRNKMLRDINYL